MPIELKMPALSPTMEEGTLAKWLVKEGDTIKSGDLLAEIETDKATMEFEAIDEGTIAKILVAEGTDGVKVGTVIATITGEDEGAPPASAAGKKEEEPTPGPSPNEGGEKKGEAAPIAPPSQEGAAVGVSAPADAPTASDDRERVKASPLARRIARDFGVDLAGVQGSGPGGRIVKADVEGGKGLRSAQPERVEGAQPAPPPVGPASAPAPKPVAAVFDESIPHELEKLSNMRKTIARRLTEAKQTVPHIYLTVDIRLDALLKLRGELNAALASREVKLSVNDLLIKALGVALVQVPKCNVTFGGDTLIKYARADVSVAVSIDGGLITPIVRDAASKGVAAISTEMKDLAQRAKDGKLKMEEYQGGTASLSNMGMFGIRQFEAVINPPQGMIMAIGAGEKRPWVIDDSLQIATIMSATGSFDHRAIDGADGAQLMKMFKEVVENPLGLVA